MNLNGKNCIVTGATHGIGKEITRLLLDQGAIVYGLSRGNYFREIEDLLKNDNFKHITCDVQNIKDLESFFLKIPAEIDILVNNAGGGGTWGSENWLETEINVWNEVYAKNVIYIIHFIRQYLPFMMKNKWGRIITISSIYGKENGGRPWYQVAKSAQISLMKSFGSNSDYVSNNVTFNTISPGRLEIAGTNLGNLKYTNSDAFDRIEKTVPRFKLGTAVEVAKVILFLCSTESSLINGANIVVDGGESKSF
jgi:3-oxoacyl-[acyl-carrier protein] reductase